MFSRILSTTIVAAGFAAISSFATAAPATPPGLVIAPTVPSGFSGAYIGADIGLDLGSSNWNTLYGTYEGGPTEVDPGTVSSIFQMGAFGGVNAGYDMQNGNVVYGIEAALSSGTSGSASCMGDYYSATCSSALQFLFDLSGRLGFALNDNMMIYARGGLSAGAFRYTVGDFKGFTAPEYDPVSELRLGGVIGVGVETKVTDQLSLSVEGDWHGFGTKRVNFSQSVDPSAYSAPFGTDITNSMYTVKAGLHYHF